MIKLKNAFLILYLVAAISSIIMIYYEATILEIIQDWGYWLALKQLPVIGANLILLLSVLMLLEVIVQKFTINKLKNKIKEKCFPYQSEMTHIWVNDILSKGYCDLPTYSNSSTLHLELIRVFTEHLKKITGKINNVCPIT